MEKITGAADPVLTGKRVQPGAWGRSDAALFALATTALALVTVQFAVAGYGAFAMDKTPTDNAYGGHVILGLVIGAMTLLILAAVLASRPARGHPRTLWLSVSLALLAVPVQSVLGEAGMHIPVIGALHALNGLVIFAVTGWLTWETARRRAASQPAGTAAAGSGARAKRP